MATSDKYANLANIEIDESAANTLTFKELATGAGFFEKMAMVIHRIEYDPAMSTVNLILDGSDYIEMAWVTSNQVSGLAKDKAQTIDRLVLGETGASTQLVQLPFVHDFANLPGGGLIVPATQLYVAIKGTSLASACYLRSSLFFTYKDLKPEEYWELVEATRALT